MPEKEYIEREAVLKVLHHRIPINEYDKSLFYDGGNVCLSLLEEFVEQLPTADVAEVKHGSWYLVEYEYLNCSECGNSYYTGCESTAEAKERLRNGEYYEYCPHCGAKMDGAKNG